MPRGTATTARADGSPRSIARDSTTFFCLDEPARNEDDDAGMGLGAVCELYDVDRLAGAAPLATYDGRTVVVDEGRYYALFPRLPGVRAAITSAL